MGFTRVSSKQIRSYNGDFEDDGSFYSNAEGWQYYVHDLGVVGSMVPRDLNSRTYMAMQLDGYMVFKGGGFFFDISLGNPVYDSISNKILIKQVDFWSPNVNLYWFDPDACAHKLDPFDGWAADGEPYARGGMLRLNDRWISPFNGRIEWCPLDRSADWAEEYPSIFYGGQMWNSTVRALPSNEAGKVWIVDGTGRVALYDTINKTRIGSDKHKVRYVSDTENGVYQISYSREFGVFLVARHGQSTAPAYLDVVVPEVQPYELTDPVAQGALGVGKVTEFQVELKGDYGEPAEGFLIDWQITAGTGYLIHSQSTTDIDGIASVQYVGPSSPTSLTLQAQVKY